MNIGLANNVREMMLHILAVELRYADRLNEMEVTPNEAHSTVRVGELFAIGAKARALFGNYGVVLEFPTRTSGTLRSSERKMFAHALLHGVRHWAQLATLLREQGYATVGRKISFSAI